MLRKLIWWMKQIRLCLENNNPAIGITWNHCIEHEFLLICYLCVRVFFFFAQNVCHVLPKLFVSHWKFASTVCIYDEKNCFLLVSSLKIFVLFFYISCLVAKYLAWVSSTIVTQFVCMTLKCGIYGVQCVVVVMMCETCLSMTKTC